MMLIVVFADISWNTWCAAKLHWYPQ